MYKYSELLDDVAYLGFNGVDTGYIGKSVWGYTIPYVHIGGYAGKQAIITAAIHARENITAHLAVKQIYRFFRQKLSVGIYYVPMVNVDGALLLEKGAPDTPEGKRLEQINGGKDFSLWKANANAVDLNLNFDAGFGKGKGNLNYPAPSGYVGKYPFDQPETAALRDFTLRIKPFFTLSYHALGREVYWQYNNVDPVRDRQFAQSVARETGYELVDGDLSSAGGYKDWCVINDIPAVTVEIISSEFTHPLPDEALKEDWERNKNIPLVIERLAAM